MKEIKEGDVLLPTRCESCRVAVKEFQEESEKLSKKFASQGVQEGVFLDMIENFCERMMKFNVHRDKYGVDRFQKTQSEFIGKLKQLADQGTKITSDIPMNLWDEPPIEAARLKFDCEHVLEVNEDILEEWFYQGRFKQDVVKMICYDRPNALCANESTESHSEL
ncbi:unnamed protein product [Bursaphelenchus okinawaensis]|uniref:DUF3456 domain-containing protein n=1 Tax=Bursaphelenchus okinawaensis TaxID=465554 RepID=A0A811LJ05_9BILA|nr:unnamed protein product [Bursaphelenchus okinawaensis]CAG9127008.1 unnamed protein product [Bursaphelenchus okinawaensis]